MHETVTVVGISGSLRDGSHTRTVVQETLRAAEESGAQTTFIDLRAYDLTRFDPDTEASDADRLREQVRNADVVVLGTPMYHGSYASPLKNALDHCSREEFDETLVGLVAVSGGSFPLPALEHLRGVCRALEAWVHPMQVAIPNVDDAIENETIDEAYRDRLHELGEDITSYIQPTQPETQPAPTADSNDPDGSTPVPETSWKFLSMLR
jgi:NAD(P)H-dependent FMN reductase